MPREQHAQPAARRLGLVGFYGWGNYGDELFIDAFREHLSPAVALTVVPQKKRRSRFLPPVAPSLRDLDAVLIGGGDLVVPWNLSTHYWDPRYLAKPVYIHGVGVPQLIVDYAGFGTTTAEAIETLAEFGRLVQVGMGKGQATINTTPIIINQLTIAGSKSGTKEDLAGIYELMRSGKLNPPMNHITFDEIPECLEKLHQGGVVGRFIAMFD